MTSVFFGNFLEITISIIVILISDPKLLDPSFNTNVRKSSQRFVLANVLNVNSATTNSECL